MTGPEHYREAERLLKQASSADEIGVAYFCADSETDLAAAQVHATLALTAATAYQAIAAYYGEEPATWNESRGWAAVSAPAAVSS